LVDTQVTMPSNDVVDAVGRVGGTREQNKIAVSRKYLRAWGPSFYRRVKRSDEPGLKNMKERNSEGAIQNFTAGLAHTPRAHSRKCGSAGTELDAAHPIHPARGRGRQFRQRFP
jgi:hypothetical protein